MLEKRASEKLQMELRRETDDYLKIGGELVGSSLWQEVQRQKHERAKALGICVEQSFLAAGRKDASNRVWAAADADGEYRIVRKRLLVKQKLYPENGTKRRFGMLRRKKMVRLNGVNGFGADEIKREWSAANVTGMSERSGTNVSTDTMTECALGHVLLPDYVTDYRKLTGWSFLTFVIVLLLSLIIGVFTYGEKGVVAGVLLALIVGSIAAVALFLIASVVFGIKNVVRSTKYEIKKNLFEQRAGETDPDFIFELFLVEALLKWESWIYKQSEYSGVCDVFVTEVIPETWETVGEKDEVRVALSLQAEITEVCSENGAGTPEQGNQAHFSKNYFNKNCFNKKSFNKSLIAKKGMFYRYVQNFELIFENHGAHKELLKENAPDTGEALKKDLVSRFETWDLEKVSEFMTKWSEQGARSSKRTPVGQSGGQRNNRP